MPGLLAWVLPEAGAIGKPEPYHYGGLTYAAQNGITAKL